MFFRRKTKESCQIRPKRKETAVFPRKNQGKAKKKKDPKKKDQKKQSTHTIFIAFIPLKRFRVAISFSCVGEYLSFIGTPTIMHWRHCFRFSFVLGAYGSVFSSLFGHLKRSRATALPLLFCAALLRDSCFETPLDPIFSAPSPPPTGFKGPTLQAPFKGEGGGPSPAFMHGVFSLFLFLSLSIDLYRADLRFHFPYLCDCV